MNPGTKGGESKDYIQKWSDILFVKNLKRRCNFQPEKFNHSENEPFPKTKIILN